MTDREQRPGTIRGKRARSDARRNRERIFAAAKEAFAELGSETGMEEIARRAGVGVGTLYRHFPSRAELVEAVYDDMVSGLAEQARP